MTSKPMLKSHFLALLVYFALALPVAAKDKPKSPELLYAEFADSLGLENKVVYIDFWASWCPPCRQSFPFMKELSRKYGSEGFLIIAINLDKDQAAARSFLAESEPPFPVLYDSAGTIAKQLSLEAIPSSFIYGRDGTFREKHEGFQPEDTLKLRSLVESLIKEREIK